jgi:hypothetical protein
LKLVQIFEALQEKTINKSRYGHPLEDIWVLLQSFPQWKCEYVSREANGVAHKLAKEATTKINQEKGTKRWDGIIGHVGCFLSVYFFYFFIFFSGLGIGSINEEIN